MGRSPLMERAKRATVYFDPAKRRWTTVIVHDSLVTTDRHLCEADARKFVGLTGGSQDPLYSPLSGSRAFEVVQ